MFEVCFESKSPMGKFVVKLFDFRHFVGLKSNLYDFEVSGAIF